MKMFNLYDENNNFIASYDLLRAAIMAARHNFVLTGQWYVTEDWTNSVAYLNEPKQHE